MLVYVSGIYEITPTIQLYQVYTIKFRLIRRSMTRYSKQTPHKYANEVIWLEIPRAYRRSPRSNFHLLEDRCRRQIVDAF